MLADRNPVTTTSESSSESDGGRVILDVEDARDVGPTEAEGLIRECLALTYRRIDAATWRALDELATAAPDDAEGPPPGSPPETAAVTLARAVRRERSKFFSCFRSEFDELFQARRDGRRRERQQRHRESGTLALVEDLDLSGQVALKSAVLGMQSATREVGLGFDLRARIVMRERPTGGDYQNPWGSELVCDALGNACRRLWGHDHAWRPVMEHLVRGLTPEVVALHREIDALLQERDILPVLRVRTRKRGGPAVQGDERSLYDKVLERLSRDSSPQGRGTGGPLPGGAGAPARAEDLAAGVGAGGGRAPDLRSDADPGAGFHAGASWSALLRALSQPESRAAGTEASRILRGVEAAMLYDGPSNAMPALAGAVAQGGGSAIDLVTLRILSAVLDEVFDNPFLPAEIKTVFGRLQIPILKASLLDPRMLSQPAHPVRRFFDALAGASVGLRPGDARDTPFIDLADRLATLVRDAFDDDPGVFDRAREELDAFLDTERAAFNRHLAQATPPLVALDEEQAARARVRTAIAVRHATHDVPAELRAFLEHEALARLTAVYLADGPDSAAWKDELQTIDDLLWSIAPEPGAEARRRLVQLIPELVKKIGECWPADDAGRARRKIFLTRLYHLHIEALKPPLPELPASGDDATPDPPAGVAPAARAPAPDRAPRDEEAEAVETLMRGDWCVFTGEDSGAPLLARFAWRSPHGTQLLFTHRDGSVAVTHTPETLADAFRRERARVAVEAVPLFERAMERMLAESGPP